MLLPSRSAGLEHSPQFGHTQCGWIRNLESTAVLRQWCSRHGDRNFPHSIETDDPVGFDSLVVKRPVTIAGIETRVDQHSDLAKTAKRAAIRREASCPKRDGSSSTKPGVQVAYLFE